ncbi:ATP-binding cassette domain-containing protein [Lactobacillus sp. DCY120]|uniref:ATP-binding cassette domain-containing protein n=1 Tax=Bombilactobacillus apium TaxID=2675299 RepID=A0A850R1G1_9LACO|nr:ATP-binding cassette domain-containing protein [Bombilactobacillus apium]NVY96763.1 ATP-binding cassette domain-containing protein [Bombilactobacillus apium]
MTLIELQQVRKTTGRQELLHDVSLVVNQGEIATLEGINGSGKTLILRAILGLITVQGTVKVAEQLVTPAAAYPIKAGILIENPSLITDFTASKNLELLTKLDPEIDPQQITELLAYFDLNRFPKQKVRKFSLGMKQKLGIAQALLGQNPLIVLDEPTNALDQESITKLVQIIQDYHQQGTTFVIASHDRDFIEQVATQRFRVQTGTVVYEK